MGNYKNPLIEGADPFLLFDGEKYYHYATSAPDGFIVHSSKDLSEWKDEGYCLKAGENVVGDKCFWAPEIKYRDGKYYMVYVANEHLAVAVADKPTGPFVCSEKRWLSQKNAIDGSFFIDDDGRIYLYYVRFDGGNVIYGAPMSDMLTLQEDKERELIRAGLEWETRMGNRRALHVKAQRQILSDVYGKRLPQSGLCGGICRIGQPDGTVRKVRRQSDIKKGRRNFRAGTSQFYHLARRKKPFDSLSHSPRRQGSASAAYMR